MLVYRDRTSAYSIPTLRTMYFWVIQRHQAGAYKACWKLIEAHDNFTGPCSHRVRKVVGSVLVGEVGAIYTPALWLTFTSCLSPMCHVLVILQSLEKHSFVTTLCARPYCLHSWVWLRQTSLTGCAFVSPMQNTLCLTLRCCCCRVMAK